jgi:hypothetical protein
MSEPGVAFPVTFPGGNSVSARRRWTAEPSGSASRPSSRRRRFDPEVDPEVDPEAVPEAG